MFPCLASGYNYKKMLNMCVQIKNKGVQYIVNVRAMFACTDRDSFGPL